MRRMRWFAACLLTASPAALAAQHPACTPYSGNNQLFNVCNASIDATIVFHPVVGLLTSGGDPVIGSFKPLGGLPHLSLTLRVNATELTTPNLNYDGTTTTVGKSDKFVAPDPVVEAALGIFKGLPSGFLAIDALGSAQLLPTDQIDNLRVDPNARKIGSVALGLGGGARVGILKQQAIVPAITVSAMVRSIPTITYGSVPGGDKYDYSINLKATNLRAMAGYHFLLFNFGAGFGWDKYTGDSEVNFRDPVSNAVQPTVSVKLDQTRTMIFADAALDIPVFKIALEGGYQFGKKQSLVTTFADNDPNARRLFAGAGLRFSF